MPARKTNKRARPVILVPATPGTPDSVPVATEDDASPPQQSQPSPNSYAQVAARPAAAINAVVWPLNTATSPARGATTQQSAATTNPTTGRGAPLDAPPPPTMPNTPTLGPVATNIDAIEPLELPPAGPWADAQFFGTSQSDAADINPVPQAPSSPIYVPSTASATPTPAGVAGRALDSTLLLNAASAPVVQSYEEFWSQFSSPSFPDTNLPSALQTPRAMAPLVNDVFLGSPWPFQPQLSSRTTATNSADKENAPPGPSGDVPHPPVTSRQRKRRRGLSPASNERAKKSARRKGKDKATTTVPSASGPSTGTSNPWATTCEDEDEVDNGPTPAQRPPPPSLPPSSLASTNQTPYSSFSRPASATTSFYGRFNMSGSYPTPHAVSNAPSPYASPSGFPSASQQQPPCPPAPMPSSGTASSSAVPRPSRTSSMRSVRTFIEEEDDRVLSQDRHFEPPSSASWIDRTSYRDVTMGEESSRSGDSNREGRRGLHDLLSDPSSLHARPRPFRRPTVEDVPEDGEEVDDEREARVASAFEWGPSANPSLYNAHLNPPMQARDEDDAYRPAHEYEVPARNARQHRREAVTQPYLGSMGSRFTEEWDARPPRRMAHDELPSRWSSMRSTQLPRGSPLSRLHHGAHPASHHTVASTATPSNRINSLDIFDTGVDDNMPEAVRRGGAASETENEHPTPIPHEGDPEVHRHDPEAHLRGMSDDWIQEVWADPSGTSITLRTFNPRYTRSYGANRRTASDIRSTVTSITGESDFLVIAPDQARNHRGRGPVEWAVTGLTREGVDRLLRRRVWSFRSITFFPSRRSLDTPRWVIALEGFLEDNVANIESAVRSTFQRPQVRQRIEQMIRANPEFNGIAMEEAFRRIMDTLRVTVYTLDNDTVVANVFLRSPTQSIRVWRCWVQELRDLTFGSHRTSIARARRVSECAGCSGVDHPSHLCPFLRMPGWNGPEIADGSSYSVDGRERRARQVASGSGSGSFSSDTSLSRNQRSQATYGPSSSQAGPSRHHSANSRSDWEEPDYERGRDQRRERYNNDRGYERNNDRNGSGPSRRGKGDGSKSSKGGRDSYRKEGRR